MPSRPLALMLAAATVAPIAASSAAGADDLLAVGTAGDIFTIDSHTGQGRLLDAARHYPALNSLGKDALGVMLSASGESLITIDEATGRTSLVASMPINDVRGLAFAPDGSLYAVEDGGVALPDVLYIVDPASGEAQLIGAASHARIQGMAIDRTGRAFAWDTEAGLLALDLATGATVDVNGLADGSRDVHSLTFAADGRLFGCRYYLFQIDPTTGARSLIGGGGYTDVRGIAFIGAANGRALFITGRCPGMVTVQWRGAAPARPAALLLGAVRGRWRIPFGLPCGGTLLGIEGRVRPLDPPGVFSTGTGSGSLSGLAGTSACGLSLQFIEIGACEVSNAAVIP